MIKKLTLHGCNRKDKTPLWRIRVRAPPPPSSTKTSFEIFCMEKRKNMHLQPTENAFFHDTIELRIGRCATDSCFFACEWLVEIDLTHAVPWGEARDSFCAPLASGTMCPARQLPAERTALNISLVQYAPFCTPQRRGTNCSTPACPCAERTVLHAPCVQNDPFCRPSDCRTNDSVGHLRA